MYIEQPEGFCKEDQEKKVCLLKKALYGLKQASRVCNPKIPEAVKEIGFRRFSYVSCVYQNNDGESMVIVD